jgi:hypothetical protein
MYFTLFIDLLLTGDNIVASYIGGNMSKNKKESFYNDITEHICGSMFILAIFLSFFYSALSMWNAQRNGSFFLACFSFLTLIVYFLGSGAMRNKTFRKYFSFLVMSLIIGGVFAQKNLQDIYVTTTYRSLDSLMIKSYAGIVDTPIYKEFLTDKNNGNISKLAEYDKNISRYLSIESEKVMQLKLFYTVTNNKDIHTQLDKVFEDGLVNKVEYEQFKIFVYQLPLNTNEQAMFTMIQQ